MFALNLTSRVVQWARWRVLAPLMLFQSRRKSVCPDWTPTVCCSIGNRISTVPVHLWTSRKRVCLLLECIVMIFGSARLPVPVGFPLWEILSGRYFLHGCVPPRRGNLLQSHTFPWTSVVTCLSRGKHDELMINEGQFSSKKNLFTTLDVQSQVPARSGSVFRLFAVDKQVDLFVVMVLRVYPSWNSARIQLAWEQPAHSMNWWRVSRGSSARAHRVFFFETNIFTISFRYRLCQQRTQDLGMLLKIHVVAHFLALVSSGNRVPLFSRVFRASHLFRCAHFKRTKMRIYFLSIENPSRSIVRQVGLFEAKPLCLMTFGYFEFFRSVNAHSCTCACTQATFIWSFHALGSRGILYSCFCFLLSLIPGNKCPSILCWTHLKRWNHNFWCVLPSLIRTEFTFHT